MICLLTRASSDLRLFDQTMTTEAIQLEAGYHDSQTGKGGHLASICGVASDASIRCAIKAGRESGIRIVVDLYAAPNMVERACEVEAMGADVVYIHFGSDARAEDPSQDTVGLVPTIRAAVRVPVGASTFDVDGGAAAVRAGADILVIGHPLIIGPDRGKLLSEYVQRAREAHRLQRITRS